MRVTLPLALVALCLVGGAAARAADGGTAATTVAPPATAAEGHEKAAARNEAPRPGASTARATRPRSIPRILRPLHVPGPLPRGLPPRAPAHPAATPAHSTAATAHPTAATAHPTATPVHPAATPAHPKASPAPRGVAPCGGPPPAAGPAPFKAGEILHYDLDVIGIRAGTLDLDVSRDPDGDFDFGALARSNTFFQNIRKVRGQATSYTDGPGLESRRYREDATEDGVKKWAEVHFDAKDHRADIAYAIGSHRRRVVYPLRYGPFDVLSVVYYVRTLPMKVGEKLCVDLYGNRKVWRLRGHVDGEEWIDTPAGKFKTWRLAGEAWRLDMPRYHRPIHVWISQDARRLPVAAVGEIDLGPVRAQLSRIGPEGDASSRPDYGGGTW